MASCSWRFLSASLLATTAVLATAVASEVTSAACTETVGTDALVVKSDERDVSLVSKPSERIEPAPLSDPVWLVAVTWLLDVSLSCPVAFEPLIETEVDSEAFCEAEALVLADSLALVEADVLAEVETEVERLVDTDAEACWLADSDSETESTEFDTESVAEADWLTTSPLTADSVIAPEWPKTAESEAAKTSVVGLTVCSTADGLVASSAWTT